MAILEPAAALGGIGIDWLKCDAAEGDWLAAVGDVAFDGGLAGAADQANDNNSREQTCSRSSGHIFRFQHAGTRFGPGWLSSLSHLKIRHRKAVVHPE